jgi:hypothetical protein
MLKTCRVRDGQHEVEVVELTGGRQQSTTTIQFLLCCQRNGSQ